MTCPQLLLYIGRVTYESVDGCEVYTLMTDHGTICFCENNQFYHQVTSMFQKPTNDALNATATAAVGNRFGLAGYVSKGLFSISRLLEQMGETIEQPLKTLMNVARRQAQVYRLHASVRVFLVHMWWWCMVLMCVVLMWSDAVLF